MAFNRAAKTAPVVSLLREDRIGKKSDGLAVSEIIHGQRAERCATSRPPRAGSATPRGRDAESALQDEFDKCLGTMKVLLTRMEREGCTPRRPFHLEPFARSQPVRASYVLPGARIRSSSASAPRETSGAQKPSHVRDTEEAQEGTMAAAAAAETRRLLLDSLQPLLTGDRDNAQSDASLDLSFGTGPPTPRESAAFESAVPMGACQKGSRRPSSAGSCASTRASSQDRGQPVNVRPPSARRPQVGGRSATRRHTVGDPMVADASVGGGRRSPDLPRGQDMTVRFAPSSRGSAGSRPPSARRTPAPSPGGSSIT